jgi:uncharacterized membrane protein YhfC
MSYLLKIIFSFISALIAIGLPIFLLVYWRRKTKARLLPALIGALVFVVFALVLEQLLHNIVLVQPLMMTNTALYVLYGGLAAGVFEETGRLLGFSLVLRRYRKREDSVTFGIGHGGIEAILLIGLNMLGNLMFLLLLAFGGDEFIKRSFDAGTYESAVNAFGTTQPQYFLLAGIERFIAIFLHISLSVLVFKAVKDRKWLFYPLAILIHAAIDWVAVLQGTGAIGFLSNKWLVELIYAALTAIVAYFAVKVYKNMKEND